MCLEVWGVGEGIYPDRCEEVGNEGTKDEEIWKRKIRGFIDRSDDQYWFTYKSGVQWWYVSRTRPYDELRKKNLSKRERCKKNSGGDVPKVRWWEVKTERGCLVRLGRYLILVEKKRKVNQHTLGDIPVSIFLDSTTVPSDRMDENVEWTREGKTSTS